MVRHVCALGFVAALAALAVGAVADPSTAPRTAVINPVTLRLKYRDGETLTYHMVFSTIETEYQNGVQKSNSDDKYDFTILQTVKSLDMPMQAATIETDVTLNSESLTTNERPQKDWVYSTLPTHILTSTSVIEPDGKVDSLTDADSNLIHGMPAFMDTSCQMGSPFFTPDRPVSVGNTWSNSSSVGTWSLGFDTNYRLANLLNVKGDLVATLASTFTGKRNSPHVNQTDYDLTTTVTGNQTLLFDNTSGVVQSETSTSQFTDKMVTDPNQPAPPSGKSVPAYSGEADATDNWTMTLESRTVTPSTGKA